MFNEVRDETDAASMLKQLLNLNAKETNKFKLNFLRIETEKPSYIWFKVLSLQREIKRQPYEWEQMSQYVRRRVAPDKKVEYLSLEDQTDLVRVVFSVLSCNIASDLKTLHRRWCFSVVYEFKRLPYIYLVFVLTWVFWWFVIVRDTGGWSLPYLARDQTTNRWPIFGK